MVVPIVAFNVLKKTEGGQYNLQIMWTTKMTPEITESIAKMTINCNDQPKILKSRDPDYVTEGNKIVLKVKNFHASDSKLVGFLFETNEVEFVKDVVIHYSYDNWLLTATEVKVEQYKFEVFKSVLVEMDIIP